LRFCFSLLLGVAALLLPNDSTAHHSHAPFYQMDQTVEVTGVVRSLRLVSPHSQVLLEVSEPNGDTVTYEITGRNGAGLLDVGFEPGMMQEGTEITVIGHPSRNPAVRSIAPERILAADGTEIPWGL
jgi:hypothetical protein